MGERRLRNPCCKSLGQHFVGFEVEESDVILKCWLEVLLIGKLLFPNVEIVRDMLPFRC